MSLFPLQSEPEPPFGFPSPDDDVVLDVEDEEFETVVSVTADEEEWAPVFVPLGGGDVGALWDKVTGVFVDDVEMISISAQFTNVSCLPQPTQQ